MKKIFIALIILLLSSYVSAQSIGLTMGRANSFASIIDKDFNTISSQLLTTGIEIRAVQYMGVDFDFYYDLISYETFLYDLNLKAYLSMFFLQPYVSIGKAWMKEPGTKVLFIEGQEYIYNFNYSSVMKLGLDIFILNNFSIGTEIAYYGNSLQTMLNNIVSRDVLDIGLNSYIFIGIKKWF